MVFWLGLQDSPDPSHLHRKLVYTGRQSAKYNWAVTEEYISGLPLQEFCLSIFCTVLISLGVCVSGAMFYSYAFFFWPSA